MRRNLVTILIGILTLACATRAIAQVSPTLASVDWKKFVGPTGAPSVRFHMRWSNPIRESPTMPIHGSMLSQEFGVFLRDYGLIGEFNVPALAGGSFFDVFFDTEMSKLPPEPQTIVPGQAPSGARSLKSPVGPSSATAVPCSPDTIWNGNVDITWAGTGVTGQVLKHYGELLVCPGSVPSYIHVRSTDCAIGAPWSVTGLCPGFSATLVNEDKSPAPNPIPPGWTGFIATSAAATVIPGTTCCFTLQFSCDTRPATIEMCVTACDCGHPTGPVLGQVDWHNIGQTVRFHMRWNNPSATDASLPVSGSMMSQEFGVFMPNSGPIGSFDVPPIAPNSFFDVFFDVAMSALPAPPTKILPTGGAPGTSSPTSTKRRPGVDGPVPVPCPPDTIWDGNVDVVWSGAGGSGHVEKHFGELLVCPGGAPSFIHVKSTTCPVGAPWSVTALCPGFTATLVNEDKSPAPNPIPPGWTGFIAVSANASVTAGTTCCFLLEFDCAGNPAEIQLCATACDCAGHGPTLGQVDWHNIGTLVRFHLHWVNPNPTAPTLPVSGSMMSQQFGVFMPDAGPIGQFDVPPIQPGSFFDVFVDVAMTSLPPQPAKQLPGGGPLPGVPCPQDTIWDGNLDVIWTGTGISGQVQKHYGDLIVCPGGAPSYIHVSGVGCAVGATWSVSGLCPGFIGTLVNEDKSPAADPLPAGWTGFVAVTAAVGTPPGTVCCFLLDFDCAGSPAQIELCATACDCGALSVPAPTEDLGFGIHAVIPSPTQGPTTIRFAVPSATRATLEVFDASGHRVRMLLDGPLAAGPQTITWDGRTGDGKRLPTGAYFLRLTAGDRTSSRKIIVRW